MGSVWLECIPIDQHQPPHDSQPHKYMVNCAECCIYTTYRKRPKQNVALLTFATNHRIHVMYRLCCHLIQLRQSGLGSMGEPKLPNAYVMGIRRAQLCFDENLRVYSNSNRDNSVAPAFL